MFPTYSEIVKTIFTQIVSDHIEDPITTAVELKIHARLSAVLEILLPDEVGPITISLTYGSAIAIVPFKIGSSTLTIQCTMDFTNKKVTSEAI